MRSDQLLSETASLEKKLNEVTKCLATAYQRCDALKAENYALENKIQTLEYERADVAANQLMDPVWAVLEEMLRE